MHSSNQQILRQSQSEEIYQTLPITLSHLPGAASLGKRVEAGRRACLCCVLSVFAGSDVTLSNALARSADATPPAVGKVLCCRTGRPVPGW